MSSKSRFGAKPWPFVLMIGIGLILGLIPAPEGMKPEGWRMLAVFVATIFGIITKAMPMGPTALLALSILILTHTLPLKEALNGFSSPIVWLVVFAFFVAKSFIKTGLGMRIAYHFVALVGKKSLGLSYGMAMTDLVLAPAIPSNTARVGGLIFPIVESLALAFESKPDAKSRNKLGSFLIQSAYHCNIITSAMFLTAMAANPMIVEIAEKMGISISWGTWALAALLPGIASLILIPFVLYTFSPPEIKETPNAHKVAKEQLDKLGKVSRNEWITAGVFFAMLVLWIGGPYFGIDSTTVALLGITTLLIAGVLNWSDIIKEEQAWDTLIWFSILLMMAHQLSQLGTIQWFSEHVQDSVENIGWMYAYPLLLLSYFYVHYFFASNTAHVSSLFAAFAVVGVVAGIPPMLLILSLAFASTLSACLTHYGTAPGPILYGSGYVDLVTWWKMGALISLVHLFVWFIGGPLWWKVLGLW